MKKWVVVLGIIMVSLFSVAFVAVANSSLTLIVNGKVSDVEPIVIDGTTYVPVRAAAEMLGADVKYDAASRSVTITADGSKATTIGSSIGDMQTFDGLAITLNSVDFKTEGSLLKPDNDHYVFVDLTLQNTTDDPVHVSTLMQMELQDDDGYKHSLTISGDEKGSLDGEIPAGDTIRGTIVFDVDKSDEYKFIFSNPLGGQISWVFNE